jgi:VIT1/CCC1 family predicted Fe2+/Mn2+ transporter|tara:strand:+ start:1587 stop:2279 length:693 start_codon:yes stop_codon:yes gene_type:complete
VSTGHPEPHHSSRSTWLRAAVLGADDGIVSTASLVVGVAAAGSSHRGVVLAGIAGLVAGAMSMAAGEYVSVSSQADTENADRETERLELANDPEAELNELTAIYVKRGLDPSLARQVAIQLSNHDLLATHLRDELGFSPITKARPVQAAITSASMFSLGAAIPLFVTLLLPVKQIPVLVSITSLFCLGLLGAFSAMAGGASISTAVIRVTFWGAFAMALTAFIGSLFGVA